MWKDFFEIICIKEKFYADFLLCKKYRCRRYDVISTKIAVEKE